MLFRKKMPKSCIYCTYGTKLNEDQVLCVKKGVMSMDGKCRKFRYDPCKRIPSRPKLPDFSRYSEDDFSL